MVVNTVLPCTADVISLPKLVFPPEPDYVIQTDQVQWLRVILTNAAKPRETVYTVVPVAQVNAPNGDPHAQDGSLCCECKALLSLLKSDVLCKRLGTPDPSHDHCALTQSEALIPVNNNELLRLRAFNGSDANRSHLKHTLGSSWGHTVSCFMTYLRASDRSSYRPIPAYGAP